MSISDLDLSLNLPVRLRRLRRTAALRRLAAETTLTRDNLVMPLFVCPGARVRREVASMPGIFNLSVDLAAEEAKRIRDLGIPAVLLFGLPEGKDAEGSQSRTEDGVVQRALRALRGAVGDDLALIADTCLCEYTDHGHCGHVTPAGEIDNDVSAGWLAETAVSQARAGADIVAPSAMMDGQVKAIREALDAAGLTGTAIMAYSAKHASALYGPFRDAAQGAPKFGDRRSYQMDPANAREGVREALLDVAEGADIVMVKPALPNGDLIARIRERVEVPVAAYNVSGEYAMVKAAAAKGWLSGDAAAVEILLGLRRAGADILITYFACELAEKNLI
jgi:porphobilinogen synthase